MRMVAVDPDCCARLDLVVPPANARVPLTVEAQNNFVTWMVVAFEMMIRARLDMARAHHGVKRLEAMIRRGEGQR